MSGIIFDEIVALEVRELETTGGHDLDRFEVDVVHLIDGEVATGATVQANVTRTARVGIGAECAEYVRAAVERAGNEFPNDGFKLKNLKLYEPVAVRAPLS